MTRETKIGLLVGLSFIIVFALLLGQAGQSSRAAQATTSQPALTLEEKERALSSAKRGDMLRIERFWRSPRKMTATVIEANDKIVDLSTGEETVGVRTRDLVEYVEAIYPRSAKNRDAQERFEAAQGEFIAQLTRFEHDKLFLEALPTP